MLSPTNETESQSMPAWLSIPIILLCLLSGGWMICWYVISDPISHESKLLGDPVRPVAQTGATGGNPNRPRGGGGGGVWSGFGVGQGGRQNQNVPFVRATDDQKDRWEVRTEMAQLMATVDGKGAINIRVLYSNIRSLLPADVQAILTPTATLLRQDNRARLDAMKLSNDQVRTLRQLTNANEMSITAAEKKTFQDTMYKFIHASEAERPAMEPALFAMLDGVAKQSVAPTIALDKQHAAEIDKILTPEVLARAKPATAPVK